MFHWLTDAISNGAIAYPVLVLASGADVIFPPVPAETMVVTAGVVAAKGDLSLWFVLPAVAAGAFIGDNVSYWLGRGIGDPVADKLFRGDKGRERLEWGERALHRHGGLLVLVGRFLPGGRTVTTFAAGTLEMPWRRFALADATAACVWAVFATMLGYAGGSAFQHSMWKPLVASLTAALLVGAAVEVWRRIQKRRGRDVLGDPLEAAG